MTEAPTNRCADCVHWAPILGRKFLGICGHPERRPGQCSDRLDTCVLFANGNPVQGKKIEEVVA